MLITFMLLSLFFAACVALNGKSADLKANTGKNLILSEQELKFAGSAIRTVLASNVNAYVSQVKLIGSIIA